MTEASRSRSQSVLVGVGVLMALTLVVFAVATALSQNMFGITADLEAFDLETGEPSWAHIYDVELPPQLTDEGIYIVHQDGVQALNEDGSIDWEAPVANVWRVTATERVIYADVRADGRHLVAALSPETGEVVWRFDGSRLADDDAVVLPSTRLWLAAASDTMAAISIDSGYWVVAAESGAPVVRFRSDLNEFAVGDDLVAYVSEGDIAVVDITGTKRTLIEKVPQSTQVSGIRDGAVVLNERGTGSGRVLHAHDTTTGAELWRRTIKGQIDPQQEGDFVHVYRSSGSVLVEHRTGALTPDPPWLAAQTTEGQGVKAAVLSELVDSPDSARYFTIEGDTVAVDSESGAVLWKREDQKPVAAVEGVAVTRSRSHAAVIAQDSGETLFRAKRAKRFEAAAVGSRMAIVDRGLVQLVAGDGTVVELAQLKPRAQIAAASDRFVAVHEGAGDIDRSRHLIVWDVDSGTRVADARYADFWDAGLDGNFLTLSHNQTSTVIDLRDGSSEQVDGRRDRRFRPAPFSPVVVVFDETMTRMLWARDVVGHSTINVVGNKLIISTMGFKHREVR